MRQDIGCSTEDRLLAYFEMKGVAAERMAEKEHREWVEGWEMVFGRVAAGEGTLCGKEAIEALLAERGREWVVVPFLSKGRGVGAYLCEGRVVDFEGVGLGEFFVSPVDFGWTFVVRGGVYFLRG